MIPPSGRKGKGKPRRSVRNARSLPSPLVRNETARRNRSDCSGSALPFGTILEVTAEPGAYLPKPCQTVFGLSGDGLGPHGQHFSRSAVMASGTAFCRPRGPGFGRSCCRRNADNRPDCRAVKISANRSHRIENSAPMQLPNNSRRGRKNTRDNRPKRHLGVLSRWFPPHF